MEPADQCIEILHVEDNPADAVLLREFLLEEGSSLCQLSHVPNGDEALAFLQQQGPYAYARRPHLILLDIGLPKRDGWEVLVAIRAIPSLSAIPVVMLSGVLTAADEARKDALQPTLCLQKPREIEGYLQLVKTLLSHKVKAAIAQAQALTRRADHVIAQTRDLLREQTEISQHHQAWRERRAEQHASPSPAVRPPSPKKPTPRSDESK